ncbi:MAG: hypothetical protein KDE58_36435 [Caldilineaceae bacterium]|nr:hypothetical protein [Caldilineaceae bacterium]
MGNKNRFGIEYEVIDVVGDWVFGKFLMWMCGEKIGDSSDRSVDLKGCIRWMRDFVDNPKPRYEPGLFGMDKDEVYRILASSVLECEDPEREIEEAYHDTFSRFHVSHIGMSSFDAVVILLVKNFDGAERFVFKANGEVMEALLSKGEAEAVCADAVSAMERDCGLSAC